MKSDHENEMIPQLLQAVKRTTIIAHYSFGMHCTLHPNRDGGEAWTVFQVHRKLPRTCTTSSSLNSKLTQHIFTFQLLLLLLVVLQRFKQIQKKKKLNFFSSETKTQTPRA